MRKITRKGLIRKLDKLVAETVIKRDGKCVVCGSNQKLTCGHLFSRVAYSTRWDLDNCYTQCLSCNFKHEYDPYPLIEYAKGQHDTITKLVGGEFVHVGKYKSGDVWLAELHLKYVTPHKFKDFELEHLLEVFERKLKKEVR
jgi:hypothetical protein